MVNSSTAIQYKVNMGKDSSPWSAYRNGYKFNSFPLYILQSFSDIALLTYQLRILPRYCRL